MKSKTKTHQNNLLTINSIALNLYNIQIMPQIRSIIDTNVETFPPKRKCISVYQLLSSSHKYITSLYLIKLQ